jgi:hypothetical protein
MACGVDVRVDAWIDTTHRWNVAGGTSHAVVARQLLLPEQDLAEHGFLRRRTERFCEGMLLWFLSDPQTGVSVGQCRGQSVPGGRNCRLQFSSARRATSCARRAAAPPTPLDSLLREVLQAAGG